MAWSARPPGRMVTSLSVRCLLGAATRPRGEAARRGREITGDAMAQATTAVPVVAVAGEAAEGRCTLSCECWDCRAWRRHLLRLAAVAALACGLAGEAGLRHRLWRADGGAGDQVALASVAGDGAERWF